MIPLPSVLVKCSVTNHISLFYQHRAEYMNAHH